jgi:hypothetical protein
MLKISAKKLICDEGEQRNIFKILKRIDSGFCTNEMTFYFEVCNWNPMGHKLILSEKLI